MSNGVLSLDDVQTSGNDGSSTDAETNDGSSASDSLADVCETLGADHSHAKAYVDEHGNKSDLVEFAERLVGNDDLMEVHEDYRAMNDIHRIIRNFLRSADGDFTPYTSAFYGDSDDPEPGTYNAVQQRSRENDGNLMFYRALFPEPQAEYWDSDPVCWLEFDSIGYSGDQQDSHIYVSREFVEEYGDFSIEVHGQERPRPPAASELEATDGGGDLPLDPSEHTVEDLRDELQEMLGLGAPVSDFEAVLDAEERGKERKTAVKAIRGAMNQAEASDGSDEQQELSDAAKAGEVNAGAVDIDPEKVIELMDEGWSKQEIIQFYG